MFINRWFAGKKGLIGALIVSATLLLSAAQAEDEASPDVWAMVTFPPLKEFSDKAASVARQVQPGPQTEMLLLIGLGTFGYPEFPGVSQEERISVFFMAPGESGEVSMVILAKLAPDSPMRDVVTQLQWVMEDREGWTLIAENSAALSTVTDVSTLVAKVPAETEFDVEARLFIGAERIEQWKAQANAMLPMAGMLEPSLAQVSTSDMERVLEMLAALFSNFEWASIGLDLSAEAITLGSAAEAVSGSPEHALFSSAAGGPVPEGKYISADAAMIQLGKFDASEALSYYKSLYNRIQPHLTEEENRRAGKLNTWVVDYMNAWDGSYAGSAGFTDGTITGSSIGAGQLTDKLLAGGMQELVEELSDFYDSVAPGLKQTFQPSVAEHKGVAIHLLKTENTIEGLADIPMQNQEAYFALIDGDYLYTLSLQSLKDLIDLVQSGEGVSDNVSEVIQLDEKTVLFMQLDLLDYFLGIFGTLPNELLVGIQPVIDELKSKELAPATFSLQWTGGKARKAFTVPVSAIAAVAEAQRQLQLKQQQALEAQ